MHLILLILPIYLLVLICNAETKQFATMAGNETMLIWKQNTLYLNKDYVG